MSSQPPTAPASPATQPLNEITVYSHSPLFYWWPVWAFGFIAAFISWFQGYYMIVVPKETELSRKIWVLKKEVAEGARQTQETADKYDPKPGQLEEREGALLTKEALDKKKHLAPYDPKKHDESIQNPPQLIMHTTSGKGIGVVWAVVLLLVIFITNVPLRGMWSVLVITTIIFLSILFWALDIWENIFHQIGRLGIQMNLAGYLTISVGLLVMWLVAFFFFDRQMYIIFQPGLMKVCLEIGSGEKAYDTVGMTIERQRSDLFRHWILGLGSGDLIVRTTGADAHEFRLNNVLFLNWNLHKIEELQARRGAGHGKV